MTTLARTSGTFTAGTRRTLRQLARGAVVAGETWLERRRQRRALLEMSDHMLKDIGVSRAAAYEEAVKPFWRV